MYGPNEKSDAAEPSETRPILDISGLDGIQLELVWYDDHKGQIIGEPYTFTGPTVTVQAPYTEPTGFGKSIAFLIQPQGATPKHTFAALPNEPIGQIDVQIKYSHDMWHEEWPVIKLGDETELYTFTFIAEPGGAKPEWWYIWTFDGEAMEKSHNISESSNFPGAVNTYVPVKVDVYEDEACTVRICGDTIHVKLHNNPE